MQQTPTATPLATEAGANSLDSPLPSPTPLSQEESEDEMLLTWNTAPESLIISATFCCGHVSPLVIMNYIPEALIWGDGRIVWVEQDDSDARRVLEDQLTSDQMQALLQRAAVDGFFSWEDRYADQSIADASEKCLTITLEQQSKRVCEYVNGAPPAFHDLYQDITSGVSLTGTEYVPERGYLIAYPLEFPQGFTPPVDFQWPADTLGLSLSEVTEGQWVEGDILELAWDIVNAKWQGMIIEEEEMYYQISVQLPDLSQTNPPAQ